MVADFFASWSLFAPAYALALLQAAALGLLGVAVVARDEVFLGAALAQASTLGVAMSIAVAATGVAGSVGPWLAGPGASVVAVLVSGGVALALARREGEHGETSAWLFAGCGAATMLVLSKHPQGADVVERLMLSRFVGATAADAWRALVLLALVVPAACLARRTLVLVFSDPVMAAAVGIRVDRWSRGVALAIGVGVGLAIASSGLVYTFGCLVLPALCARRVCSSIAGVLCVAPAFGVASALVGLFLAHAADVPPGQAIVVLQAVCLGGVRAVAWVRR